MLDWVVAHRIFLLTVLAVIAVTFLVYFVFQEAGIRIKGMSIDNVFQMLIFTVLAITAVILFLNLLYFHKQFKESAAQTRSLQEQISLTKLLNRPICAVKNVEIVGPEFKEYRFFITVMNFGQYIAKNISFSWECLIVKIELKNNKTHFLVESSVVPFKNTLRTISLLPQQEFKTTFYIHESKVGKVIGNSERGYLISVILEYEGIDKKTDKYICKYLIYKPKTITGATHVILLSSDFETF